MGLSTPIFDKSEAYDKLKRTLADDGVYATKNNTLKVYDVCGKKEKTLKQIKVDFTPDKESGLHACHVDPLKGESVDNMFLHLPGRNIGWDSTAIDDMDHYMNETTSLIRELMETEYDVYRNTLSQDQFRDFIDEKMRTTEALNESIKSNFEELRIRWSEAA